MMLRFVRRISATLTELNLQMAMKFGTDLFIGFWPRQPLQKASADVDAILCGDETVLISDILRRAQTSGATIVESGDIASAAREASI